MNWRTGSRSPIIRYALPFAGIILALLVQFALSLLLPHGSNFPYAFLYLVAVFAVAWFGGYVPGVISCLLTMVALPFSVDPHFRWSQVEISRLLPLAALSVGISAVAQAQRRRRQALSIANDELDRCVQNRTEELARAVRALEGEVAEHKKTEHKLETQLERLNLLDQITRAIGQRLDLRSVFQVVIRSLEDNLPIDFGCVCRYEPDAEQVIVTCVGVRCETLATELATTQSVVDVDRNGLVRCIQGHVVYEEDLSNVNFPFPQRLAAAGLRAMVAAPLLFESQVFGVLVAARREAAGFSSADCEFLRQLSEHVALAANQAQVHTALQQAYDELRQTQQAVMQQERLRALGQMASGIAHDINNAISPVALYTEMLLEQEPNLSRRTREYLETTQCAIGDVAHTVSRMREFYRQHEPELILSPVDLSAIAQQVLDLTRARWSDMPQKRGVVIRARMELDQDLPQIAGIESEIREALTNLIFNAVDAMPEGGTLTVRTKAAQSPGKPPRVDLEVTDTGVGMDDETRRRCLEPFFTTKGERGTGLGLAMVYGVMQRHNADIELDSAAGKGTTVRLKFPVPVAGVGGEQPAAPAPTPARLRILSVDDDPLLIKSLRDALEADGHAVVSAHGGQEGIDIFESAGKTNEPFAAVITDLGMPYVDGRKVAEAVKRASPSTPVILLTGWGQRLVADGDIPPHVDKVLNKPPKLRELRAALAELTTNVPTAVR